MRSVVTATRSTVVLIVQPYVPDYRVPLFNLMHAKLRSEGYDLVVACGEAKGDQLLRRDGAPHAPWKVVVNEFSVSLGRVELGYRQIKNLLDSTQPSLIILEQAVHNLESYEVLFRLKSSGASVAFWGHGDTFTEKRRRARDKAKFWLTRRSNWFFAYTAKGAEAVRLHGFPEERITILWNSTDTIALKRDLSMVSREQIESFLNSVGAKFGKTILFLGGLDERKGLTFLIDSLQIAHEQDPEIVCLVGGEGRSKRLLESHERAGGPVRVLGRLQGEQKALALRSSSLLAIPEWVGLVAVDSLAAAVPIVTTDYAIHAPEYEYLKQGRNCSVVNHSPEEFAGELVRLVGQPDEVAALAEQCERDSRLYSVEAMADRFVQGIQLCLGQPR